MTEIKKIKPDNAPDAQTLAAEIIAAAKEEAMRIIMAASAGMKFEPSSAPVTAAERAQPNVKPRRILITLSENKEMTRGGQYFGVNGAEFLMKPGRKTNVPEGLKDVLDNAVEGYAVQDPDTLKVVEWRERLKYPYVFHGYVDEQPTA